MKLKNYIGEENLAVLEVVAVGLILLVTAFQIYDMVRPYDGPEQPEINASYDAEENLLNLTVVNGSFIEAGSREVSLAYNERRESNTTFTIHGYGKTENTSYWATKGILALNSKGITRFPIKEGEKISVELEETPERRLYIRGIGRTDRPAPTHIVFFENDSAVAFTGSKYLDLREKQVRQTPGAGSDQDFMEWYQSRE